MAEKNINNRRRLILRRYQMCRRQTTKRADNLC